MIDFRYHLVSIVSIFLALAVGIVLGAGPLKEDIGNTLTTELTKLREDRTQLRAELDDADKAAQARDAFTEASNASLLAGRLQGTTLAVVVLPGADPSLVEATTGTLAGAGARIGSTVTVLDAWLDPDQRDRRTALADRLAPMVQVPADRDGAGVLDSVLARSLLTRAGSDVSRAPEALEELRAAELIRHTPEEVTVATGAVVIGGPVEGGSADERSTRAEALSALAAAFDAAGSGAVLAVPGPEESGTAAVSVVDTTRQQADRVRQLSTVDHAQLPMGQASIVFALLEQFSGSAGHYGLEADTTAAFPALAAP